MPLTDKRIVAIDDTYSILNFLRISLESIGMKFHGAMTASGGARAVRYLPARPCRARPRPAG